MLRDTQPLICLAGPTASGKSAISLQLAAHWPVEIINVDSATIYRAMDIGTAKPDAQERIQVAHHLLDILDPCASYSAAQFRADALACVADIRRRGRIPLLVGGTMLYFKVLQQGMDDLPGADPIIRADIEREARDIGWPGMHRLLALIDPITARRLSPNDSQRIGRALEIHRACGQPMSSLIGNSAADAQSKSTSVPLFMISLEPSDRAVLHRRIEQRFDQMLASGLLEEVRALFERGDLHIGMPSMRCVGYRQLWEHLEGNVSFAQARDRAIAATRQLAKRQLTWLRSMPDRHAVDCLALDAPQQVMALMQQALNQHTASAGTS